jgi:hypothetical protein
MQQCPAGQRAGHVAKPLTQQAQAFRGVRNPAVASCLLLRVFSQIPENTMHARNLAFAMMMLGSAAAHAQYGMTPMVNPLLMGNPLAALGLGGMVNPLGMAYLGSPLMSAQMYNPQALTNPYLNPMAANNPYLNPRAGMGNPFMPQQASSSFFPMMPSTSAPAYGGYGAPAYGGYGSPAYGAYGAPGYGVYGRPAAPAQPAPLSFFPMPTKAPPAPAQAAPMPFFPTPSQRAPASAPAPAQAAPMPFFPMAPQAAPTPAAAPAPIPQRSAPAPAGNPFDAMMWMQPMGGTAPATPASPAAPATAK